MANTTVSLVWYCRTEKGWRHFPVVESKNGKIKTVAVLADGVQRLYPNGRFQLRRYEGSKTVYLNADVKSAEAQGGLTIVEDPPHKPRLLSSLIGL